ncbi:tRNA (guanosine(37)-N1)-methyltransferase TrmD [Halalkalibacterium halodurans]|jgi:tRNA (guanine37-N1)-methyltransferase|uniref:tRNA (guanosine(37)-N1)-methyltransferase TrmD n=1 Tax=Halalkalibacterium halodurans TaxID=86665 RepID=UPI001068965E|nr:tRNA (guanosine(37)-N1)-methyltransferase TrmD [Halalkalibacterium halodurans]MED3646694.1 tRNA (guanosine(37)-N1)-methyltransferase TrmD [Halalkalibacterium halodurans]TES54496.1 tRNA (guanosine(37)-N1)-methyltransferase TrmD [Halalkalibacterium halodurans]
MKIDFLTLFPEMFQGVLHSSILKQAQERGAVSFRVVNFREYSENKHKKVDDYPYGGGAGMVLSPQPLFHAVEDLTKKSESTPRVILMCPQGETFTQRKAEELAQAEHLILLCGHYEGYDERIRSYLVTDELSIGDYVLTGGELGAMVIADSVTRLLPAVLGNETSAQTDSFSTGLLEHPQYTRPADFRGWKVPDVLLSGHHQNIERWRKEQSLKRTLERRPDLLEGRKLTEEEQELLDSIRKQQEK